MRRFPNQYYQGHPPIPNYYFPYRQFLPVNPNMFMNSARKTTPLLMDALTLMNKISSSQSFAKSLMDAAQHSKTNEAKKIIRTIGIQSKVDIHYNPSGLIFILSIKNDPLDCCQVEVRLRWM